LDAAGEIAARLVKTELRNANIDALDAYAA